MPGASRITNGFLSVWLGISLTVIGFAIQILTAFGVLIGPPPPRDSMTLWDLDSLNERWAWRTKEYQLNVASVALVGLGTLFILHPFIILKRLYRIHGKTTVAGKIMVFAIGIAVVIMGLEFLELLGAREIGAIMSNDSTLNTDVNSMRALEIAYRMTSARSLWVLSCEPLFTALALICYMRLTIHAQKYSKPHAVVGLLAAVFAVFAFGFEISSFFKQKLMYAFGACYLIYTIFWIIWLIWLSLILHRHEAEAFREMKESRDVDLV